MRILVVRNPRSGLSRRAGVFDRALSKLRSEGHTVEVATPGSRDEARAMASSTRKASHDVLLAAGGDGTVHVVANGLVTVPRDERPALALLPSGRGNDFAAEIGIGSVDEALDSLRDDHRRFVDVARTPSGIFLSVAGVGFDAAAARAAQDTSFLSGRLLYSYAVVRTLLTYRPIEARIAYDGGQYEGRITFAAVGNTRRYGGGMFIAPRAELDDGLLDLCLVREISKLTLLYMFPTVFLGRHLSHPSVEYHRTRFVEIYTNEPAELFADGEYLQTTPVRIELMPRELEVVTRGTDSPRAP